MKKDHTRKDFKVCFLKYLLLCSLSSLMTQDVSSTSSLDCEIRDSCNCECQDTNQMTVDPGSNVTLNCSIMNGGLTRGMTWERVRKSVKASDGLFLQQMNSTGEKNSYRCTCIKFTSKVKKTFSTSSPGDIHAEEQPMELKCRFEGWPVPRVVWSKDGKPIKNGSEGFYLSEKLDGKCGKDTLSSFLRQPKGQEKHEGIYHCIAKNSIPGWSSETSGIIQMIYQCPSPEPPTINSSEVSTTVFSDISLKCLVEIDPDSCLSDLRWYFNNNSAPLKTGEKYKVEERKTNTKCKKDFILNIVNVTDDDEGKYSCHYYCDSTFITSADIELKVYHQPSALTTIPPTTKNTATSNSPAPHSPKSWIMPTIIVASGCVFVLITFVAHRFIRKRCTSSPNAAKRDPEEGIRNDNLFVSYSSKDFAWVNENLISLLEKHSISYSIHTRDFELGRPIVQNMADSVYGSRQVLIVLSDNYLASNFCREELHMAVQREVDAGDSSLILVMINKLKKKRLPGALKSKNLLDFEKYKMKQDWEKKLLHAISDGNDGGVVNKPSSNSVVYTKVLD